MHKLGPMEDSPKVRDSSCYTIWCGFWRHREMLNASFCVKSYCFFCDTKQTYLEPFYFVIGHSLKSMSNLSKSRGSYWPHSSQKWHFKNSAYINDNGAFTEWKSIAFFIWMKEWNFSCLVGALRFAGSFLTGSLGTSFSFLVLTILLIVLIWNRVRHEEYKFPV